MPASAGSPVTLGYVSRPNGLAGAVVIHSDPSMAGTLAKGLRVELVLRSGERRAARVRAAAQIKGGTRVAFDEIDDRTTAESLVGATVVVDRMDIAGLDDGDYLDSDLVGLEVFTRANQPLGRVVEIIATGANDVYVVAGADGSEILVPATANAGIEIDLAAGRMTVEADALEYGSTVENR